MIHRLNRNSLTEEDFQYIEDEKEFLEEFEKMEQGYYDTGKSHRISEGFQKGKEASREEAKRERIAKKVLQEKEKEREGILL